MVYNIYMAKQEKPKSKSTIKQKQKRVADKIVENRGTSVSKAMRDAGYSKAYSKNPKQMINTKSWQELMEEYIPDDLLVEKHKALLNKTDKGGAVDTVAVSKGLDLAYKIKGKNAPEKHEHNITGVEIVNYSKPKDDKDKTTS